MSFFGHFHQRQKSKGFRGQRRDEEATVAKELKLRPQNSKESEI